MPPKAGGIHFRRPHLKSLGSPHDGYHRVGRGATWTGETSSIPRPSLLPRDSDGRPLWAARFIAAKRGKGLTFPPFRDNIVRAETAMTEQVPLTPPHQRRVPWLEGPAAGGRETAPPAGPETGAVPFPQQKARGRFLSAEHGWHHESRRFRPVTRDESAFLRISALTEPKSQMLRYKGASLWPRSNPVPCPASWSCWPQRAGDPPGAPDLTQIGRNKSGLFQGFAAQNA